MPKKLDDHKSQLTTTTISKHLEDKKIAKKSEFSEKAEKFRGQTGYIATRNSDDHDFMIKIAPKVLLDTHEEQDIDDFTELVTEFVVAPLFKQALYNRAPIVEMVVEDNQLLGNIDLRKKQLQASSSGSIMIRSKFLENFEPLEAILGEENINADGIEKVIAARIKFGDFDYSSDNLGQNMVSIDHGKALKCSFDHEQMLRQELVDSFADNGYTDIDFNLEKFIQAIQDLHRITPQEIATVIDARYALLKDAGVQFSNPGKLTTYCNNQDQDHLVDLRDTSVPDQMEAAKATARFVIEQNTKTLDAIADTLKFISKIAGSDETWKNKQWLYDVEGKDPIAWAVEKDLLIEGKDPLQWAIDNNKKIGVIMDNEMEYKEPLVWAAEHDNETISSHAIGVAIQHDRINGVESNWLNFAIEENKNIFDATRNLTLEPVVYAIMNNLEIDKNNALLLAIENDQELEGLPVTEWLRNNYDNDAVKESIKASVIAGEKINGVEIVLWLHENDFEIDGKNPVYWAAKNNVKIAGQDASITASQLGISMEDSMPSPRSLR